MTTTDALKRIASLLALDTFNHRMSARENPNLIENAQEASQNNTDTAKALGIIDQYSLSLSLLMHG